MNEETGSNKWRKQIMDLSDEDLIDELTRPTHNWEQDVLRESLKRILENLTLKKINEKEDK